MKITKENAKEILVRGVIIGQSKGAFSIKEAAILHDIIKKEETDYQPLLKAVIIANGKGCFSLEDASVINKVIDFLNEDEKE